MLWALKSVGVVCKLREKDASRKGHRVRKQISGYHRLEGGTAMGEQGNSGGDGTRLCPDCADGYTAVYFCQKYKNLPWPVWLSGLSASL